MQHTERQREEEISEEGEKRRDNSDANKRVSRKVAERGAKKKRRRLTPSMAGLIPYIKLGVRDRLITLRRSR
jgi:hypothetical protein